ncbi:phosphotransferase [Candidatus Dojkabacteria bacterium]|nr:phosphotransferase [Candidatus Dojkabacteria bacterium]
MDEVSLKNVLTKYGIGELISAKQTQRESPNLQRCYFLDTTKGKYFLKRYNTFSYSKRKGLDLIKFLYENDYPCIKVILSNQSQPYVVHEGFVYALFEAITIPDIWNISENEAFDMGKQLGRLHILAKDMQIRKSPVDYFELLNIFNDFKKNIPTIPGEHRNKLEYIEQVYPYLALPDDLPQSICHGEFTPEHIFFSEENIVKIIDWDLVGYDYMFYDLATALIGCFQDGVLKFNILSQILKGYESSRKLTDWEQNHIFEGVQFGVIKFAIWYLDDIDIKGWENFDINLKEIMKYDKNSFDNKLNTYLK